jgi:hypothetical protein
VKASPMQYSDDRLSLLTMIGFATSPSMAQPRAHVLRRRPQIVAFFS